MKSQTSGFRLTRRNASRLAGALGLLLALCFITGGALPAYAGIPTIPNTFYGTVSVVSPPGPVADETVVEAYVDGAWAAETHVAGGRYRLDVPGTAGAAVTFLVGGAPANQTATPWKAGATNLNLTIAAPPVVQYDLTVDSSAGGAVTDPGEGVFPYDAATVVDLFADPGAGYQFDEWTGDTGAIDDADAADTFITMNGTYDITANFELITPPGEQKLIGADDATGSNETLNYIFLTKFQAVATGQITEFREKSGIAGQVKVAIYADSGGEPGARLSYNNTAQNVVVGWNTLSIPALDVITGTYYWLGIIIDTSGAVLYRTSAVFFRYKAATFSTFTWPDPAGSSYYSAGGCELVAGWGSTVALVAPAAPTRDCTRLTFRWNTSTGATKYWLQVNTSSGFEPGTMTFEDNNISATSREVTTGLTAGTTYYYRVKAGNAAGWSDWSSIGSMRCGDVPG
jgi:hypothetical protein